MQIAFENAGFRRRADEPGGLELVQQPGGGGQMRSSGHMVAECCCIFGEICQQISFKKIVFPRWQTETGGICISPRPSEEGAEIVRGKAMRPMFGIQPALVDEKVLNLFFFHTRHRSYNFSLLLGP